MIDKLKKIKSSYLVSALAAGLIMVVLSNSFMSDNTDKKETVVQKEDSFDFEKVADSLTEILESIDGVSDVSVLVTYENYGEEKIATVTESENEGTSGKKTSKTREVTDKEGSLEKPFVTERILPKVRGVIIAARGVKKTNLEVKITDAVSSALGVPVHRVKIIPKD